jgi:glutathione peroxidase
MKAISLLLLSFTLAMCKPSQTANTMTPENISSPSFYDLEIQQLNSDQVIQFSDFKGKKVLLVNVASKCGFTYQYEGLQELHDQYKDQLVVIGFPSNQFLFQEPGSDARIDSFCKVTYQVQFLMSTKIKVKGESVHPIYQWLCQKELNGVSDHKVSWNFNKFLVDEQGQLLAYFPSKVKPKDPQIIALIEGS